MKLHRQGDVLIVSADKLPDGAVKKSSIVAEGEVTGHHHQMLEGATVYDVGGAQYVDVESEAARLVHDTHGPHEIEKGTHEVIIQHQLDLAGQVQRVID
jgi:hypothetical protein